MMGSLMRRHPMVRVAVLVAGVAVVMSVLMSGGEEFRHTAPLMICVIAMVGALFAAEALPETIRYEEYLLALPVRGRRIVGLRILAMLVPGLAALWIPCLSASLLFGGSRAALQAAGHMTSGVLAFVLWLHAISPGSSRVPEHRGTAVLFVAFTAAVFLGAFIESPLYPTAMVGLAGAAAFRLLRGVPESLELATTPGVRGHGRRLRISLTGFLLRECVLRPVHLLAAFEAVLLCWSLLPGVLVLMILRSIRTTRVLVFVGHLPVSRRRLFAFAALPGAVALGAGAWLMSLDFAPPAVAALVLVWYLGACAGPRLRRIFLGGVLLYYADEIPFPGPGPGAWILVASAALGAYLLAQRSFERAEVRAATAS